MENNKWFQEQSKTKVTKISNPGVNVLKDLWSTRMKNMNAMKKYSTLFFSFSRSIVLWNDIALFTYRNSDERAWKKGVSEIHNAEVASLSWPFTVDLWRKAEIYNSILLLLYGISRPFSCRNTDCPYIYKVCNIFHEIVTSRSCNVWDLLFFFLVNSLKTLESSGEKLAFMYEFENCKGMFTSYLIMQSLIWC